MNPAAWLWLNSGQGPAALNMAVDEALLEGMPRIGRAVLRFYGWTEAAASFGYFQKYSEVERLTPLRPLVRRPTGGGIVPHDADWTYSLGFPVGHPWNDLTAVESYRRVHEWLQAAFAQVQVATSLAPAARKAGLGQCFAGHERSDLLWSGRKIAGAAQRRTRAGLLIQGSVQPPPGSPARDAWERAMRGAASARDGVTWQAFEPDRAFQARVDELIATRYSLTAFNRKR